MSARRLRVEPGQLEALAARFDRDSETLLARVAAFQRGGLLGPHAFGLLGEAEEAAARYRQVLADTVGDLTAFAGTVADTADRLRADVTGYRAADALPAPGAERG